MYIYYTCVKNRNFCILLVGKHHMLLQSEQREQHSMHRIGEADGWTRGRTDGWADGRTNRRTAGGLTNGRTTD